MRTTGQTDGQTQGQYEEREEQREEEREEEERTLISSVSEATQTGLDLQRELRPCGVLHFEHFYPEELKLLLMFLCYYYICVRLVSCFSIVSTES